MNLAKRTAAAAALALLALAPTYGAAQSMSDLEKMQTFLQIMESYFGIIESTHEIGSNPEKAAIMQMQKIQEVFEDRGEKARSVDVLRQIIEETDNQTVRNAAYLMISDTLKESGKGDEAIALLRQAIAENMRAAR